MEILRTTGSSECAGLNYINLSLPVGWDGDECEDAGSDCDVSDKVVDGAISRSEWPIAASFKHNIM